MNGSMDILSGVAVVLALFILALVGRRLGRRASHPQKPPVLRRWQTREYWRWLAFWWILPR